MNFMKAKIIILSLSVISMLYVVGANTQTSSGMQQVAPDKPDSVQMVHPGVQDVDRALAQLNYCIMALTNIINAPSLEVYNHQQHQLLNNLTITGISGFDEVAQFRKSLLLSLSELSLSEGERALLKRTNNIQKDNLKWSSLSNALSAPMMLFSSGGNKAQIAFYTLLTVARTYVDYNVQLNNMKSEELSALWDIRKKELQEYTHLRAQALDLAYSLYQNYPLKEFDRLTEETSRFLSQILLEPDAGRRIRLLLDHSKTYEHIGDYHYYLGMAYVDQKNYALGKLSFDKYIELYNRAPLFRYNDRLGTIALTRLVFDPGMTEEDVYHTIKVVQDNLPNNGSALMQCILAYLKMGHKAQAYSLLRTGLDNPDISNYELLFFFAAKNLDDIRKYPQVYNPISETLVASKELSLSNRILLLKRLKGNAVMGEIAKLFHVDEDFNITCRVSYPFELSQIFAYKNEISDGDLEITQMSLKYPASIEKEDILSEVQLLEDNPSLLPLFFVLVDKYKETYLVKKDVDFRRIKNRDISYPLYTQLAAETQLLSDSDLEELAEFGLSSQAESQDEIHCSDENGWWLWRKDTKDLEAISSLNFLLEKNKTFQNIDVSKYNVQHKASVFNATFVGDSLVAPPKWLVEAEGEFLQLYVTEDEPLCITYKKKDDEVSLYSLEIENQIYYAEPLFAEAMSSDEGGGSWFSWIGDLIRWFSRLF